MGESSYVALMQGLFIKIIEYINTTILCLNTMTVQLLVVEHAVLFHASVDVLYLFALPGYVSSHPLIMSTCQISASSPRGSNTFSLVELFLMPSPTSHHPAPCGPK